MFATSAERRCESSSRGSIRRNATANPSTAIGRKTAVCPRIRITGLSYSAPMGPPRFQNRISPISSTGVPNDAASIIPAELLPTSTAASAPLIQAQVAVLKRAGIDPVLWPRNAGSYPGYVFTGEPLKLASGHFGLGHGSGAHAPDEYDVIESANPKVQGFDGAVLSFVQYLYELAK